MDYNFKNPRIYKNSKPMIRKFFSNFSQAASDDQSKMSIQMIMNNFRRKKIISTLKDGKIPFEEKNEVLQPYGDYIKGQFVPETN